MIPGIKKRLDRITARLALAGPQAPRTFAGFVKWEADHRAANGGELTPAESEWIGTAWREFMDRSQGRRV